MLFIALLAVVLPLILLAVFNMPAMKGMAISAAVVSLAGWFFWHIPTNVMLASILQGIHKTFPILWILFGALMVLHVLRHTGAITRINAGFESLSANMRILAVLIAYLCLPIRWFDRRCFWIWNTSYGYGAIVDCFRFHTNGRRNVGLGR